MSFFAPVCVHMCICIGHNFEYLCACETVFPKPLLLKVCPEDQQHWHHLGIGGNAGTQEHFRHTESESTFLISLQVVQVQEALL